METRRQLWVSFFRRESSFDSLLLGWSTLRLAGLGAPRIRLSLPRFSLLTWETSHPGVPALAYEWSRFSALGFSLKTMAQARVGHWRTEAIWL